MGMGVTISHNGNRQRIGADFLFDDIGIPGQMGYGVGVASILPEGMSEMEGTRVRGHDNYGNYQYADGSIMGYIPAHYAKVGTGANGLPVNVHVTTSFSTYPSVDDANDDGYFLPRAFINGGVVKRGVFVDKYKASKKSWGTGQIASSIKNGKPISTSYSHNPIADLTACAVDGHYEAVNAAKARDGVDGAVNADSIFFCNTRFVWAMLAFLSMAHGQAASSTSNCAWYDATGVTNFPKGSNNAALGDTNDAEIDYVSDVLSYFAETGSGTPFAKTTHNGQACGLADMNGNMWEINLGLTRPGAGASDGSTHNDTTAFYVLKESVDVRTLTAGWNGATDAWGDATRLAALYDAIDIPYVSNTALARQFGNAANQVLSEATSGDGYKLTGLGFPKDANAKSSAGTNLFGDDMFYEYQRANLTPISGGSAADTADAGIWACNLSHYRSNTSTSVGFRCACYPD